MTFIAEPRITRRQNKEERREQILDAAVHIFSDKGFAGASMRDIAREVGVTEGLLYHYFEGKDQLLYTCWKERSWRASLEKILAESEGIPLQEVLRAMIADFTQSLRDNADMVRICSNEMQHNPEMREFHTQRIEDNGKLIADFLRARQATGEIRPDVDVYTPAFLLMGSAYSLFSVWGHSDEAQWSARVDDLLKNGIYVVMFGISPTSDTGL